MAMMAIAALSLPGIGLLLMAAAQAESWLPPTAPPAPTPDDSPAATPML